MSAVLGLPEWIRHPDCETIDDPTLEHGTEPYVLFRFIDRVIHANQSEAGLFPTQSNSAEMLRRYNTILSVVDVLLHAIEDQAALAESAPATPAPSSVKMLYPFAIEASSSPSIVKIEHSPSSAELELISPVSIAEPLGPLGSLQPSNNPDPETSVRDPSSPLPSHHGPEDDSHSTATTAITANNYRENFPTKDEILAAIPPQGATVLQLIEILKGRTAGRERDTASMAKSHQGNFPTIFEIRTAAPPGGATMHQLTEIFKGRFAGREREFVMMIRESGIRLL